MIRLDCSQRGQGRGRQLLGASGLLLALACSEAEAPKQQPSAAGSGGTTGGSAGAPVAGSAGSSVAGRGGVGGAAGSNAGSGNATAGGGAGGTSSAGSGGGGLGGSAGSSAAGTSGGGQSAGTGGVNSAGMAGTAGEATAGTGGAGSEGASLLVFSRTTEYRHDSIPAGITALTGLAAERGWTLTATEDPSVFNDAALAERDAVIFLSTSGDMLDATQQAAFERYIRAGGGFVGIHSASAGEYDWPFFGELVGAFFNEHPEIQEATVHVEDATHPATQGLPDPWRRVDEWYGFRTNPRPNVDVLLTLDESSYSPGAGAMGSDHPIAWCHEYEGARSFYTALGHTNESYSDPLFLAHVAGGIEWVLAP